MGSPGSRRPAAPRPRHGGRGVAQEARGRSGEADGDRLGQGRRPCVEAGPVRRQMPRALYAAGLLTVQLGALLVAWFVSGWANVRSRQRTVRDNGTTEIVPGWHLDVAANPRALVAAACRERPLRGSGRRAAGLREGEQHVGLRIRARRTASAPRLLRTSAPCIRDWV